MRNFLFNVASSCTKDIPSVRFPHPFVYHFDRSSSLGITTGTKYFRGHRVQKKLAVPCNVVEVETLTDMIE